jgi:Fe-S cluster assembly ATPase SufC
MSIAEEDAFLLTFDELLDEVVSFSNYQDIEETMEWVKRVICYNISGGKQIRYNILSLMILTVSRSQCI